MADRILQFLVNYLGAQAGGLSVAEAQGIYTRVGALGVEAGAAVPAAIKPGEGLLGRAVVEKSAIRIDSLPPDYLKIGSGLGGRRPHSLLIAQLGVEDAIHGVIELGFLRPTSDTDLEL